MKAYKLFAAFVAAGMALSSFAEADDKAGKGEKYNKQGAKYGSPEEQFVTEAACGNMAEVKMGELAAKKGQSSSVRQYGEKLARDHQEANQKLQKIAQRKNIQIPQEIDKQNQKSIDHLTGLSGTEFDKAFLQHAVKDHKKDIKKFEKQACEGEDPAIRSFASEILPTLREHLQIAQTLSDNPNASLPQLNEPAGAESKPESESEDQSSQEQAPQDSQTTQP
jgi:putative membrane protein